MFHIKGISLILGFVDTLKFFLQLFSALYNILGNENENAVTSPPVEVNDLIARLSNTSSKSKSTHTEISSIDLRSMLEQARHFVNIGLFETKQKKAKNAAQEKRMSDVWKTFDLILLKDSGKHVPNINWCTKCKEVIFNPAFDGGTNYLRRHKCHKSNQITSYMPPKKKIKFVESDEKIMRNACVNFIAKDIRPFYAIEGHGLRDLLYTVSNITKKYPMITKDDLDRLLPSRRTIQKDLHEKAQSIRQYIKQLFILAIANVGGFSCTTDMWTDDYQHEKYIGLTAHMNFYENNEFISENFVFYVDVMKDLYCTAEAIRKKIIDVFAEFDISESDVMNRIIFTTDRGGNVKAALKTRFKRTFCMAHYMSNIVHSMCNVSGVKSIVKNAAKLVKYLKRSGLNSHEIMQGATVKGYCKTRWNTVHDMLKSIVLNYSKIIKLLELKESQDKSKRTKCLDKIACLSREKMENIADFLEFFRKAIKEIEYETKPVLHRILPLLKRIDSYLQLQDIDSDIVGAMKETGRVYINLRENKIDMNPTIEQKLAVLLHPLMKGMRFATDIERNETKTAAINLMEELFPNSITDQNEINEQQQRERQVDVTENNNNQINAWEQSLFSEFCDEIQPLPQNSYLSFNVESEMTNYLNFQICPQKN